MGILDSYRGNEGYLLSTMQPIRARRKIKAPTQDAILDYFVDYKADPRNDGNNPTYQEIARALGVSKEAVYQAVLRMVGHGILRFNGNRKLIVGGRWIPPGDDVSEF